MIEPLSPPAVCRMCGDPLDESSPAPTGLCRPCTATQPSDWPQSSAPGDPPQDTPGYPPPPAYPLAYPVPGYQVPPPPQPIDPDHPRWGVWTGLGVWLFSIASLIVVGVVVLGVLFFVDHPQTDAESIRAWAESPRVVVINVYSTIPAHLLTLLFCWAVVTRLGAQPFFASIGWNWAGRSPLYWLGIGVAIFIGVVLANKYIFERFLPEQKSPFDDLLKTGPQVRLAIAILASTSAPVVEEIVYRGVLYGGLRKRFSAPTTIIVVTLLFTGVHVMQYRGAWASIAGLMLLSLMLTLVRAKAKSLLPSISIHFINNAIISLLLVLNKGDV